SGITIEGTASADSTIEAVAYSLDGGNTWKRAEGGENWYFNIAPEGTKKYSQIQVKAWTTGGVMGSAVELGTIQYDQRTYNRVFRDKFQDAFDGLAQSNTDRFMKHVHSNFFYRSSTLGIEESKNQFETRLSDFINGVRNLTVDRQINQILTGPSGGEIKFFLEVRGTDDRSGRPFIMEASSATLQLTRNADGT
ncbi:MAG: hypothetical protein ABEK50_14630, partial [bacterium]